MPTEHESYFSSDSPLTSPTDDELGYAPFAEGLSRAISKMAPKDGLVIALNGPWGSGNSTILNFVLHNLSALDENSRPLLLRFNPWLFTSRDDLARLLLGQFQPLLGDKDYGEVKRLIADLAELASKIPSLPGGDIGEFIAAKLRGLPDLPSLKNKIDGLLAASDRRILVVIDDIDRLDPVEIVELFRTVKAAANFPNVIYLLAFDAAIVAQSIGSHLGTSGADYVEKIVQVPFFLPPSRPSLPSPPLLPPT